MLTQSRVKELFYYNPNMGQLIRRKSVGGKTRLGDVAGTLHNAGYIQVGVDGKLYLAHRLVWLYNYGRFPLDQLDHIDGNRVNNRLTNLREVSNLENHKNQKISKNNSSGVQGVGWHIKTAKWRSYIQVEGRSIHLGLSEDFNEAVRLRKAAEVKYNFHPNHGRSDVT